ncbi:MULTISPECIES: DUF397 domain-containing protein [unclassified Streptomyces]|uniref:DUF397 domain-containing protein n=1 Tax=unclassified Streptomyces TaxID=2593676 RepID=UPI00381585FC
MNTNPNWQKSSFSEGGAQCIEIAGHGGEILMRESDNPNVFTTTDHIKFTEFISSIKAGEFDHFAS